MHACGSAQGCMYMCCHLGHTTSSCALMQDAENNWQFDIFGFAEATKGFTLSLLYHHLMKQTGIIQELRLDETNMYKYVLKIESGYDANNPYHNRYLACNWEHADSSL